MQLHSYLYWLLGIVLIFAFVRVGHGGLHIPVLDFFVRMVAGWILPRESVIGFGPVQLAAGERKIFEVPVRLRNFVGDRLIVPSSLCNSFNVEDIRVDQDSQCVSAHPIPAAAFSELGVGVKLGLKKARRGSGIYLVVVNTTSLPATFSAALIGKTGLLA